MLASITQNSKPKMERVLRLIGLSILAATVHAFRLQGFSSRQVSSPGISSSLANSNRGQRLFYSPFGEGPLQNLEKIKDRLSTVSFCGRPKMVLSLCWV
jgi:hypothetical protein